MRAYRYLQYHKNELEKLVEEMLEASIIQPSSISSSNPVLLVWHKDGSWWFCMDYRYLNKETMLDMYPIQVIKGLLNELHGARVFTKVDLKFGCHQILLKPEDVHKTHFIIKKDIRSASNALRIN